MVVNRYCGKYKYVLCNEVSHCQWAVAVGHLIAQNIFVFQPVVITIIIRWHR